MAQFQKIHGFLATVKCNFKFKFVLNHLYKLTYHGASLEAL